ncbi:MAG: hypothetical protein ABJB11_06685 [Ferruginibacter sp.]
MKIVKTFLLITCFFLSFYSCKKDDQPTMNKPTDTDTLTTLAKRWKIVKDSVSSNNYTTPRGGIPIPGVYYGVSDDYYLFDSSYHVNVHENGHDYPNGIYKLLPGSQIIIDTTDSWYVGDIKTLNNVDAIIEWIRSSSNGGTYFRRLTLTK